MPGTVLRAAALVVLGMLSTHAAARGATEAEKARLAETVAAFDASLAAGDHATIIDGIHPAILAHMADVSGLDAERLKAAILTQVTEVMRDVSFVSFEMDLERATYSETATGTPFATIPTETVMDVDGAGRMRATSTTVAALDGETWYLIRVDNQQQLNILRAALPEFREIEIAPGTLESVDP